MDTALPRRRQRQRWMLRVSAFVNRVALSSRLAVGLAIAAVITSVLTAINLAESPLGADPGINLALIVIIWESYAPCRADRLSSRSSLVGPAAGQGRIGLHARLVLLFSSSR